MSEHDLADALAEALQHLHVDDSIVLLALDCQPWNGFCEAAVLTTEEADRDPSLFDTAEMAAWGRYAFTSKQSAWGDKTARLRERMKTDYGRAANKEVYTHQVLSMCAKALAHPQVVAALSKLDCHPDFRCSVTDPDTGVEFVTT